MSTLADPDARDAARAVREFDAVFGEMDAVLWCISRAARADLQQGRATPVVEGLVWTIKSWWGVQGVRTETRALIARALAEESWKASDFTPLPRPADDGEPFACGRVESVVRRSVALGAGRQEFSLVSKALHWLLPWRVPVYDSFVRGTLGAGSNWGHTEAYRHIVGRQYRYAERLMAGGTDWLGGNEPRSFFRALDKYFWWIGGGNQGRAAVVKHPWSALCPLGLSPSDCRGNT